LEYHGIHLDAAFAHTMLDTAVFNTDIIAIAQFPNDVEIEMQTFAGIWL